MHLLSRGGSPMLASAADSTVQHSAVAYGGTESVSSQTTSGDWNRTLSKVEDIVEGVDLLMTVSACLFAMFAFRRAILFLHSRFRRGSSQQENLLNEETTTRRRKRKPRQKLDIGKLNGGNASECPICLCSMNGVQKARRLPCSHIFHDECIRTWLVPIGTGTSCPLCKEDLVRRRRRSDPIDIESGGESPVVGVSRVGIAEEASEAVVADTNYLERHEHEVSE